MRLRFLIYCCLIPWSLLAQSLGESTYRNLYLRNSIRTTELGGERGIWKDLIFFNIPQHWTQSYERNYALDGLQGLFGSLKPSYSFLKEQSFHFSTLASDLGELDFNFRGNVELKRISAHLSINGHFNNQRNDANQDDFLDLDLKRRFIFYNTWSLYLPKFTSINKIRYLSLETQGGSVRFDKARGFRWGPHYGTGQQLDHFSGESSNYVTMREHDQLFINLRVTDHNQENYYGPNLYIGQEWRINTKVQYNYRLENEVDIFKLGFNYNYQRVLERYEQDSTATLVLFREESVGGGYVGYEVAFNKKLKLSTKVNIAYHNLIQWQIVPQLRLEGQWTPAFSSSLLGGTGIRYANVLSERPYFLLSNRKISLPDKFDPERAWYYGVGLRYNTWLSLFNSVFVAVNFDANHTIYQNKVLTDVDQSPDSILYYNSTDRAERILADLSLQWRFLEPQLGFEIGYRFDWFQTTTRGAFRQEVLHPMNNLHIQADYRLNIRQKHYADLMLTWVWYDQQRLPDGTDTKEKVDPVNNSYPIIAPAIHRLDAKLSIPFKDWFKKRHPLQSITLYVGVDNILNQVQPLSIINGANPAVPDFDGGLFWNSTVGRRFYAGVKYDFM